MKMHVLRDDVHWIAAYATTAMLSTVIGFLLPTILGGALDAVLGRRSTDILLILLCIALPLATGLHIAEELLEVKTSTRATKRLRLRLIHHIVRLDLRHQQRFPGGDVLSRLLEGTSETARAASVAVGALVSVLTSVGGIVALLLIDIKIGVVLLLGAPLVWLLAKGIVAKTSLISVQYQRAHGEIASRFVDAIRGIRTIRAAGTIEQEAYRVLAPLSALRTSGLDFWMIQREVGWKMSLLAPALQIGVLGTAGYGVVHGSLTPGSFVMVTGYLNYAFGMFRQVGVLAQLGRIKGSASRVREVLELSLARSGTRTFPPGPGDVRLQRVTVRMHGRTVLDEVDLHVAGGTTVAVVGQSGIGKSTLVAVVGGLLEPDSGKVTIDGVDLSDADPTALRHVAAYAFERPTLLGDTVLDAIRYGDQEIAADAVTKALRESSSDHFVARLPKALNTPVDELRASGGEIQRLGLARAFSRNPRVLVLDDAMSSVDTVTEFFISQALQQHRGTRIIVAHRMSTAARANQVVWLRPGGTVELGRHVEFLDRPGYTDMFGQTNYTTRDAQVRT